MNLLYIVFNESTKISLVPYSEGEKARADRDYSGISSLLNSSKACLGFLYCLNFQIKLDFSSNSEKLGRVIEIVLYGNS